MAKGKRGGRDRTETEDPAAALFHRVERVFYIVIAGALVVAGAVLFVVSMIEFGAAMIEGEFIPGAIELLEGLLLVFIVTELVHTVRAVIDLSILRAEPFLIVGIVAAIRRIITISAEAQDAIETGVGFEELMVEMGVLIAAVLVLGATLFLLRHTEEPEPAPAHEREEV